MFTGIDLSSDTATRPSIAMKKFMIDAVVGDEQRSEDPSTLQLEKLAAKLFGFETAIYLPSATMANQIAIQVLTSPSGRLFAAENCHLFRTEYAALAKHTQVLNQPIPTVTGIFNASLLKEIYLASNEAHNFTNSVLSIENTVNLGGGAVWPLDKLKSVIACAKELNLRIHLDGSRIFNASVSSNTSLREIAEGFDMVTICLSKGLGCPVGALLIFNEQYYQTVRYLKKLMGGAMRQTGILAAAGIYAFENNIIRLSKDHENAKLFAEKLSNIKKIKLLNTPPETNIIFFDWDNDPATSHHFLKKCEEQGLRFSFIDGHIRAVIHLDISYQDIIKAVEIIRTIAYNN